VSTEGKVFLPTFTKHFENR